MAANKNGVPQGRSIRKQRANVLKIRRLVSIDSLQKKALCYIILYYTIRSSFN